MDHEEQLEKMIDSIGLEKVLEMLSAICAEKAEHVRSNWQDVTLARAWERNAKAIDKALPYIEG